MLYKHPFIYEAIKEAMSQYEEAHGFNPTEMIADELGLRGPNKKQQLYNKLNVNSEKYLKLDEFIIILNILQDFSKTPLRSLANHFKFRIEPIDSPVPKGDIINIVLQTNIAMEVGLGEFAKEVMQAIEDGELDYDEAVSLRKRVREFKEILDALDQRLKKETEL